MNDDMLNKVRTGQGFIAALDQSGGSTPKALKLYGIEEDAWSNDDEMFDLMHAMRTRIMTSPAFTGDRVLGAILFEQTMDRLVEGRGTADYLWSVKNVVPFLKVDKGLADAADGAQIMKPIPGLTALCERAVGLGVFGTKMRSVVQLANGAGVNAVVDQQFEAAKEIIAAGLVPIIEPEVDIHSPEKEAAEGLLRDRIATQLDALSEDQPVMLKLSIPTVDDFYAPLIEHPRVLRVVALSGGYPRDEANERLSRQHGMIASFSRALTEGLSAGQSDDEFNGMLASTIDGIFAASIT
ncbi:MAG TPA: fructose bisphosphate aldolase [Ilumatobacteraceae bacterium]|nr:fructose bisphosphate aldolase [Ilumatobacteraceae bacterium]